jgi:hypothetical protein
MALNTYFPVDTAGASHLPSRGGVR